MSTKEHCTRVARWFVFKPKIPILVKFGGPWNRKCSYIYDHLKYFTAIWYNLLPLGILCWHLVYFFRFGMFGLRKIWQPCIVSPRIISVNVYCQISTQGSFNVCTYFDTHRKVDSSRENMYIRTRISNWSARSRDLKPRFLFFVGCVWKEMKNERTLLSIVLLNIHRCRLGLLDFIFLHFTRKYICTKAPKNLPHIHITSQMTSKILT
jgi:hypothetical protein